MRHLPLALCLAVATTPALAQGTNRSWRGDALRYTPSSVQGCDVAVMEASTSNNQVTVWLRHGGTRAVSFTLGGELAGNGQRSIASTTTRLTPGRSTSVRMMRPYNGSLAGSILTLRGSACTFVD
jgi:hypothetical protein